MMAKLAKVRTFISEVSRENLVRRLQQTPAAAFPSSLKEADSLSSVPAAQTPHDSDRLLADSPQPIAQEAPLPWRESIRERCSYIRRAAESSDTPCVR